MRKLSLEELGRQSIEEFRHSPRIPLAVVLDNIRSALNVGSVFRSCDSFAVEKLFLCGITARPPHKEINKTAIGATQSVEWEYCGKVADCLLGLKDKGYTIAGVEQTDQSIPLQRFDWKGSAPVALVFGNELDGLSDEIIPLLDLAVEVPQFGTKHSLNVSVCAGVLLWEAVRVLVASDQ